MPSKSIEDCHFPFPSYAYSAGNLSVLAQEEVSPTVFKVVIVLLDEQAPLIHKF